MKKISSFAFVAMTAISVLTSCKKDATPQKFSDVVQQGTWHMTARFEDTDNNGTFETDTYTTARDCEKDNFSTFTASTIIQDEGATKCNATDPQTITYNYTLNSDQSHMTLNIPGLGNLDYTILSVSANSIVISATIVTPTKVTYTKI